MKNLTDIEILNELVKKEKLYDPECHFIDGFFITEEELLNPTGRDIHSWIESIILYSETDRKYYTSANEVIEDYCRIFQKHEYLYDQLQTKDDGSADIDTDTLEVLTDSKKYDSVDQWSIYDEYTKIDKMASENMVKLLEFVSLVNLISNIEPTEEFEELLNELSCICNRNATAYKDGVQLGLNI